MDTMTKPETELHEDGDTCQLDDGRVLRLRVLPDDTDPFEEYECYGRVGFDGPGNDYSRRTRPEGFDGNAERIYYGNQGPWWWQPPADVKRTDPGFAAFRQNIIELLAFGMCGYVVELLDGEDAYRQPIVVAAASLWGIEPFADDAFIAETVADLVAEVVTRTPNTR